jgi:hypothetical protein
LAAYVYTSTTAVNVRARSDYLDGEDILPGLRLSLQEIFDEAGEPA